MFIKSFSDEENKSGGSFFVNLLFAGLPKLQETLNDFCKNRELIILYIHLLS